MNSLEQLKKYTVVVADPGEFDAMKEYQPTDATTNPSLILAASKLNHYQHLIEKAVNYGKTHGTYPLPAVGTPSSILSGPVRRSVLGLLFFLGFLGL
ncbi:Transaldolase like protein [Argiope bruennichi]|uniref:Transaldolase like protein n=1 Tax=Argiope bruennichi TaxID=94029 RepID=A0A8T0EZN8_ARGBR|nr:Transaldolase like protein [Argiope bruennichi]